MMASEVAAASQQGAEDKSRAPHKASDKRRAQNRAAQKTYREKRKKRLQELEQLAADAGLIDPIDKQGSPHEQQESPSDHDSGSGDATSPSGFSFMEASLPILNTFDTPQYHESFSKSTQPPGPRVYDADPSLEDQTFHDINNSLLWPTIPGVTSTDIIQPPSYNSFSGYSSMSPQSCTLSHSSASSDTSPSDEVAVRSTAYLAADPTINQIWFQTTSVYAAYIQNMCHLGIMVEDPCMDDVVSLFYTPNISKSQDQDALVRIVQNNYSNIKPDLRPTKSQIIRKHPAYLDVLPFPELRDRLIELLTADPPLMDEEEFLRDVEAGGVICWGSTMAGGQSPVGCGAPWDSRSWEAKMWFLNKWNWLIGEESDLARNSAWWRAMRGHQQGISF
jgi:hypothetical protein